MRFYKNHEKVLRRIITCIIPSKSLRCAMTSALKYDSSLIERLRLSRQMRRADRQHNAFNHFLSVTAIMKNEGPYLREWIEYHKLVGVEKFYLYDNESTDDTKKILAPYIKSGLVEYTFFPGDKCQLPAYADCINRHKNDTKWMALIDLDEFILPFAKKSDSDDIKSVLARLPRNVGQVVMSCRFFGSNGHETKPDGLVMENYTKYAANKKWQPKTIMNPRLIYGPFVHRGDTAGRTLFINVDKLCVNHYCCKSWEEYSRRKNRGDAFFGKDYARKTFNRREFDKYNHNDIENTDILRFAPSVRRAVEM